LLFDLTDRQHQRKQQFHREDWQLQYHLHHLVVSLVLLLPIFAVELLFALVLPIR
jgi:hypothetical protein